MELLLTELNMRKNWMIGADSPSSPILTCPFRESAVRFPSMSGMAPISVNMVMHRKRKRIMKMSLTFASTALSADGPVCHAALKKARVLARACIVSVDGFISLRQAAPNALEKCFHAVATKDWSGRSSEPQELFCKSSLKMSRMDELLDRSHLHSIVGSSSGSIKVFSWARTSLQSLLRELSFQKNAINIRQVRSAAAGLLSRKEDVRTLTTYSSHTRSYCLWEAEGRKE